MTKPLYFIVGFLAAPGAAFCAEIETSAPEIIDAAPATASVPDFASRAGGLAQTPIANLAAQTEIAELTPASLASRPPTPTAAAASPAAQLGRAAAAREPRTDLAALYDRSRATDARDAATEIFLTPASFTLSKDGARTLERLKPTSPLDLEPGLRQLRGQMPLDPAQLRFFHLARRGLKAVEKGAKPSPSYRSYVKEVPRLLERHFLETAAKYGYSMTQAEGLSRYRIQHGIQFWTDFVGGKDPKTSVAATAFLNGANRPAGDFTEKIVRRLTAMGGWGLYSTLILPARAFSPDSWNALARFAQSRNYNLAPRGDYVLLGGGASLFLTDWIMRKSGELPDPDLRRRHERVMRYMARNVVPIQFDEYKGSAAFYSSAEDRMAFVQPARSDLNSFDHEVTHARFHHFLGRMRLWAARKNYALPYEVEGPQGGYLTLLNELNSWRAGERFDHGMSDDHILKILRRSYAPQAGQKAVREFGRIWSVERVHGVPVPRLIIDSIRRFNATTESELAALGRRGIDRKNEASQQDFLRLLSVRYVDREPPPEIAATLAALETAGATAAIRDAAAALASRRGRIEQRPNDDQLKTLEGLVAGLDRWIDRLDEDGASAVPDELEDPVFLLAARENILDYDAAISRLETLCGRALLQRSKKQKNLFGEIVASPGRSFQEKTKDYLRRWNARDFDFLWERFARTGETDDVNVMINGQSGRFGKKHVRELLTWAMNSGSGPVEAATAIGVLELLLDKLEFGPIYTRKGLRGAVAYAREENRKAGLPADTDLPKRRMPRSSHWLFSPEIDALLARGLFDGAQGGNRVELVTLLIERTYPSELPKLYRRLREIVVDGRARRNDSRIARNFMIPGDNDTFPKHLAWGKSLVRLMMSDPSPSRNGLIYIGEYYRLGVAGVLRDPRWGQYAFSQLDRATRRKAQGMIERFDSEQRRYFEAAQVDLWKNMHHWDPRVRRSATYAAASYAGYLVEMEDEFLSCLNDPRARYEREEVVTLFAMTRPGFFPKLEKYFASHPPKTAAEKRILELRAVAPALGRAHRRRTSSETNNEPETPGSSIALAGAQTKRSSSAP